MLTLYNAFFSSSCMNFTLFFNTIYKNNYRSSLSSSKTCLTKRKESSSNSSRVQE